MEQAIALRTAEQIDAEIAALEAEYGRVQGREAEVYSRIVGYYRSVRNWNAGKKEEFADRLVFDPASTPTRQRNPGVGRVPGNARAEDIDSVDLPARGPKPIASIFLFTRKTCPMCPAAKKALSARRAYEEIDVDSPEGMSLAIKHSVLSTPTALFLDAEGEEEARRTDAASIAAFLDGRSGMEGLD